MSAYEFLSQLLIDKFDVPADKITPEASLQELGMDSLSVVELVFDTEDEFDIEIAQEDATFKTLGEAAELVERLVAAEDN